MKRKGEEIDEYNESLEESTWSKKARLRKKYKTCVGGRQNI